MKEVRDDFDGDFDEETCPDAMEASKLDKEEKLMEEASKKCSITFAQVNELCESLQDKKEEISKAKAVKTKLEAEKNDIHRKILSVLKELGREEDGYKSPSGVARVVEKWNFKKPVTQADMQLLFNYMKDKDDFDTYATVDAGALKRYYKAEREEAIRKDPAAAVTFSLPGVPEPTLFEDITLTKK